MMEDGFRCDGSGTLALVSSAHDNSRLFLGGFARSFVLYAPDAVRGEVSVRILHAGAGSIRWPTALVP